MLPLSLLSEELFKTDGVGPPVDSSEKAGKLLVLTLAITRILEQESLEVSVWGSEDGSNWAPEPLVSFPRKFYCGTYSMLLNLSSRPQIKYLSVHWKFDRLGKSERVSFAGFHVEAEESGNRIHRAVA